MGYKPPFSILSSSHQGQLRITNAQKLIIVVILFLKKRVINKSSVRKSSPRITK
uniref:Uncharacterized protein n=1 Tax=Rhizophora mucronata TaxID=61149 RepID=A0A2P2QR85_RHIMU